MSAFDDEIPGHVPFRVLRHKGALDRKSKTDDELDAMTGSHHAPNPAEILQKGDDEYNEGLVVVGWWVREMPQKKKKKAMVVA